MELLQYANVILLQRITYVTGSHPINVASLVWLNGSINQKQRQAQQHAHLL
jgi:hypothetical protein